MNDVFNLIKKDFLSLLKSKGDLIELLGLPLLFTIILGFALGNLMSGDFSIDRFDVGIINQQEIQVDLERLEDDLTQEGLPDAVVEDLVGNAEEVDSVTMLIDLLESEDFEDQMNVVEYEDAESAEEDMSEDELAGYIVIPEEFSYSVWQSIYFDEENEASLEVRGQGEGAISSAIFQSVVRSFVDQYNLESSVALATDGEADLTEDETNYGEVMQLSVEEPVSAFQYYTVGMGVMFALSVASVVAMRAFDEKTQHVFGRIMLSGKKPLTYLLSKWFFGTVITFLQLALLFVFSSLLFGIFEGRSIEFWMNMIYITGLYSLFIGSLSSLLVAMTLYANDSSTASFFGSFVALFGFLGGSMTPVEQFSETLQTVGNWLPNGAALTSYLQVFQGFAFQDVLPLMMRIIVMSVICIAVSVIIFPKRRLD